MAATVLLGLFLWECSIGRATASKRCPGIASTRCPVQNFESFGPSGFQTGYRVEEVPRPRLAAGLTTFAQDGPLRTGNWGGRPAKQDQ